MAGSISRKPRLRGVLLAASRLSKHWISRSPLKVSRLCDAWLTVKWLLIVSARIISRLGGNPARLAFPVRLFWLNTLFNRGRRNPAGCISIPCICTAPYSAYSVNPAETKWTVQDTLTAYDPEWVMTASTNNKSTSESYRKGTIPKGSIVEWDKTDSGLHTAVHLISESMALLPLLASQNRR